MKHGRTFTDAQRAHAEETMALVSASMPYPTGSGCAIVLNANKETKSKAGESSGVSQPAAAKRRWGSGLGDAPAIPPTHVPKANPRRAAAVDSDKGAQSKAGESSGVSQPAAAKRGGVRGLGDAPVMPPSKVPKVNPKARPNGLMWSQPAAAKRGRVRGLGDAPVMPPTKVPKVNPKARPNGLMWSRPVS